MSKVSTAPDLVADIGTMMAEFVDNWPDHKKPETSIALVAKTLRASRDENNRLRAVLERCETILGNMALEREGALFNRWPIHHEPLRSDARNVLPLIRQALGAL